MVWVALVATVAAVAAPVDAKKAAAVARSFWSATLGTKGSQQLELTPWQYEGVYLFTQPQGGWIMVAADDCARPVLAYSTTGTFDKDRMPVAMQNIVAEYGQEIAHVAAEKGVAADAEWATLLAGEPLDGTKEEEVGPLMTTQWYQRSPYNMYCPSYTMTGCVATAMAQVMKYWNYPAFGEGSHSYSDNSGYGLQSADFGNTRYDWPNMPDRLTSSSSTAEKEAVAILMYHCGVSVDMGYSTIYSGTTINKCEPALKTYFRYNKHDIRYRAKGSMSNDAWTDTLIAELRLRRPVLHGGSGPAGGHCFVADGFDAHRYIHFNLGEDGDGDGFYQVGAITYGAYAFNQGNDAILGVHPEYGIYLNVSQVGFDRHAGQTQVWFSSCDTLTADWRIEANEPWITYDGTDFAHLGQVTVGVTENNTGMERSGTVTFVQGDKRVELTVVQNAYDPATDFCQLTVEMENTHSEPWAGDAYLSFESLSGTVYGTARHTASTRTSTATVSVAPHDVMVRWHRGGALDRYINYKIKNRHGEVIVDVQNAYFDGADVLISWPCSPLSIDEAGQDDYQVWPNPTTGQVTVGVENGQPVQIVVLDAAGRELMRTAQCTFDLGPLGAGVYYIRVVTERGVSVKKVIRN